MINLNKKTDGLYRMTIRIGIHQDWVDFDSFFHATRVAWKMKEKYPWYTIGLKKLAGGDPCRI